MNCAKCGLHLPNGAVHCPSCAALVPRNGLLRKLAQALGLGGPGSRPGLLTRTRVIETRTERYQVKDARTGEMRTYTSRIGRYRYRVGHMTVRHMCADGLSSRPSPSSGCLKFRPTMSVNSSSSTCTSGSKA